MKVIDDLHEPVLLYPSSSVMTPESARSFEMSTATSFSVPITTGKLYVLPCTWSVAVSDIDCFPFAVRIPGPTGEPAYSNSKPARSPPRDWRPASGRRAGQMPNDRLAIPAIFSPMLIEAVAAGEGA